jgi:hypothetical protein
MNKLQKLYLEYDVEKDPAGNIGHEIANRFYKKRAIPQRNETLEFVEKHKAILEEIAANSSQ